MNLVTTRFLTFFHIFLHPWWPGSLRFLNSSFAAVFTFAGPSLPPNYTSLTILLFENKMQSSSITHGRRQRREISVLALPFPSPLTTSDTQEKSFLDIDSPLNSLFSLQHSLIFDYKPVVFLTLHGSHSSSASNSSAHSSDSSNDHRRGSPTNRNDNKRPGYSHDSYSNPLHMAEKSTKRRPPPLNLSGQYYPEEQLVPSPSLSSLSPSISISNPLSAPIHLFGSTISPVNLEFSVPSTRLRSTPIASPRMSPISPLSPHQRIFGSILDSSQDKHKFAATLRRRKMAKLTRTLGEQVPLELVFGRQHDVPGNPMVGKTSNRDSAKTSRETTGWSHPVTSLQVNVQVSVTETISSPPPSALLPHGIRLGTLSPFRFPWSRSDSGNRSPAPFANLTFVTSQ
jgi:hypothetical protein